MLKDKKIILYISILTLVILAVIVSIFVFYEIFNKENTIIPTDPIPPQEDPNFEIPLGENGSTSGSSGSLFKRDSTVKPLEETDPEFMEKLRRMYEK